MIENKKGGGGLWKKSLDKNTRNIKLINARNISLQISQDKKDIFNFLRFLFIYHALVAREGVQGR